jgi:hypothetical protein
MVFAAAAAGKCWAGDKCNRPDEMDPGFQVKGKLRTFTKGTSPFNAHEHVVQTAR